MTVVAFPPKPKRMSERRYRELYDSIPHVVRGPGIRIRCCGEVSAEIVARSYRAQRLAVTVEPTEVTSNSASEPTQSKESPLMTDYERDNRVELVHTTDIHTQLRPGDLGTVTFVDDLGTVHIKWDSGSRLGMSLSQGDEIRLVTDGR